MTAKHINVADAKARFSSVLDEVLHHGGRYVIERHGREVAAIVSVAELKRLDRKPSERPGGAMALVGLWQDIPEDDIDTLLADLREARDGDAGRSVELGK